MIQLVIEVEGPGPVEVHRQREHRAIPAAIVGRSRQRRAVRAVGHGIAVRSQTCKVTRYITHFQRGLDGCISTTVEQ